MGVRFGDCVYRFAFPALPMVLFNHFRTVSVHTAYIPEAVQKITRFLCLHRHPLPVLMYCPEQACSVAAPGHGISSR